MAEKRKIIGVFGARIFDENAINFMSELRRKSLECGYFIVALSSNTDSIEDNDDILGECKLLEGMKYVELSSIVILVETLKNRTFINSIVEIGKKKNIPVFAVDGKVSGCYNITFDYSHGFEDMVRHVIEHHGVKRVNMLAGFENNSFSDERVAIYKRVLAENGIPFEEERFGYGEFWDRPTRNVMNKFLKSGLPMPEAIICANDTMAITACSLLNEAGYSVPEDIIVTGFDGTESAKYYFPAITTSEPDYQSIMQFIISETQKAENTGEVVLRDMSAGFCISKNQSCGCEKKVFSDRNTIISRLSSDVGDCAWHNLAMNQMVTSVIDKTELVDIFRSLPDTVRMWSNHYRFACVKSDLMDTDDLNDNFREMTTILEGINDDFIEEPVRFSIKTFVPALDTLRQQDSGTDVMIVRLMHSGKNLYGYTAEGFGEIDTRSLQRCNEFSMFLEHAIEVVHHNKKLQEMNSHLTKAYKDIEALSVRDPLTGIYNRRGFFKYMDKCLKDEKNRGKYLYIVSIDLDRLKYINDTFGHAEGDFAISAVANAMGKLQGDTVIYSRFGGDEFCCAVIDDREKLYTDEKLRKDIQEWIKSIDRVCEKPYPVQVSLGVMCRRLDEEIIIDNMISEADAAMYSDKVSRRMQREQ